MAEIAAHHEVHGTQVMVMAWKTEQRLENAAAFFGGDMLAADGKSAFGN